MKSSDSVLRAALSDLSDITVEQLGVLLMHLVEMFDVSSESGADALTSAFEVHWDNNRSRARRAGAAVALVAQNIRAETDIRSFIARAESLLGSELSDDVLSIVEAIGSRISEVEAEIDRNEIVALTRGGVTPSFNSLSATVELRAVFGARLDDFNHALSPNAKIVDLEPVASIRIDLDSGDPDRLAFQISRSDLDHLIRTLEEIRMRMDDLVTFARSAR